ncbi:hypothetical protein [Candidatus Poriferisodalis sp.]|uniref:hypothetical protein n=1 Tax=Candidatus Poriferisodalis sp. TaxID=3101277 RepID=UPI003B010717
MAYTAVLGDMGLLLYRWQLRGFRVRGFTDFKVKLSGSPRRDRAKLAPFVSRGSSTATVRLDANNLWETPEQCTAHLDALGDIAFAVFAAGKWFTAYLPTAFHLVLASEVMLFAAYQRRRPQPAG